MTNPVKQNGLGTIVELGKFKVTFHDQKSASVMRGLIGFIVIFLLTGASGYIVMPLLSKGRAYQFIPTEKAITGNYESFTILDNKDRIKELESSDKKHTELLIKIDTKQEIMDDNIEGIDKKLDQLIELRIKE